jgi:hypothetical protein
VAKAAILHVHDSARCLSYQRTQHSFKSRVIRLVKPAQRWLLHMPDEFIIGSELLLHPSIQTNHELEETILFSREQAFLLRNCHVRE